MEQTASLLIKTISKKLFVFLSVFFVVLKSYTQINTIANDCADAIPICENQTYNAGTIVNQGDDCDVNTTNRGCIIGDPYPTGSPQEIFCRHEYSPAFFYFKIQNSGTLEFLAYNSGTDLDWMLYGPATGFDLTSYCSYMRATTPIRCNFSATPGQATGCTGTGAGQTREPALAVSAGQVYVLLIQQWGNPPTTLGFDLYFNGGSGSNRANTTAVLDCGILPVEFSEFYAKNLGKDIQLKWTTSLEIAIEEFSLLRWKNGEQKIELTTITANGTPSSYQYIDENLEEGFYMYQILTKEQDGSVSYSNVISIYQGLDLNDPSLIKVCNTLGQELDKTNLPKNELLIFIYKQGKNKKTIFVE